MDEITDVFITAEDPDWLAEFTKRLIADGLAACGNIIPGVRSVYTWQGAVEEGNEALLILHTRAGRVQDIIDRTNHDHPDDTPQILALPVSDSNPGYRDWLVEATGGATG